MAVFLVLAGFVAFILYRQIWSAFLANPGLNALILGVMFIGIVLAVRQVWRLFPEVRWVNTLSRTEDGPASTPAPVLLAPMAALIANRSSRSSLSVVTMRSLLDSIGARLDESREIVRYLGGSWSSWACSAPSGASSRRWARSGASSGRCGQGRMRPCSSTS
jgi:hypothetical protein